MIVWGCFSLIAVRNVSKTHLKVSVVSSPRKAHPNKQVFPWPVMPINGANGRLYLFVWYVVSKLIISPYSAYSSIDLPSVQNMFFTLFSLSS
uniref:Uncharacterized protein n=1 Tax=Oryza meridionalis TaxID=40149 RepID=A0A0E0FEV6_9ORYZ